MDTLLKDIRYGIRVLMKRPTFTVVAALTLALGVGANAAIFSVVDAVILKPLPFEAPDRLFVVWEKPPTHPRNSVAAANFLDWKDRNEVFEQMAARSARSFNLSEIDQPEKMPGLMVSPNYFDLLGVKPAIGRTFRSDEDQQGRHQVVVITNRLWQKRFGADRNLVGNTITLDGEKYTVIGILQPNSNFDRDRVQVYAPLVFSPGGINRSSHFLTVLARLKPGVTVEQAQSNMDAITAAIAEQAPQTNKGWGARLDPLRDQIISPELQKTVLMLFVAVCFVLLTACANLGNLTLARAATRHKEISIRSALGASRLQLIRQLMTESLLLSLLGGIIGILLGLWLVDIFTALMPPGIIPAEAQITIDHRVLLFAMAVTILTGVIFGLAPAWQASKTDLNSALKEGSRDSSIPVSRRRLSRLLIVSEIALALVLLIGSGLLIRSLLQLQKVELGFRPENVLTMHVSLPQTKYKTNEQVYSFYSQMLERIEAVPGVEHAGLVTDLPIVGWSYGIQFSVEGRPQADTSNRTFAHQQRITPDYFAALGIPLLKGRKFTERDNSAAPPVVIINETFARRYFSDEDPVGKRLAVDTNPSVSCEIVGIAGNVKVYGLGDKAPEENLEIYAPFAMNPSADSFIALRATGPSVQLAGIVQREIQSLDKDQPVTQVRGMEEIISGTLSDERFNTMLIALLAAVAVALSAVGIYGIISFTVTQHTREIGIRMALGAQKRDIFKMILGYGLRLTVWGVAIGLVGAFALTRLMSSMLYGVSATDSITFAIVTLLLIAIALLACYLPARRATRVDPMVALRYE